MNIFSAGVLRKKEAPLSDKFAKKSYAQSGEDLIVRFLLEQELKVSNPGYIDIGAHHPFYLSNTASFYESGSRGINIEPDPTLFAAFDKYRQEDINLNIGVAPSNGYLDFYFMSVPTLNTFSEEEALRYEQEDGYKITEKRKIKVSTLEAVIGQYCGGTFPAFLNIDVEGLEESVFSAGFNDGKGPLVICAETVTFSEKDRGVKKHELIRLICSKGYMAYADTFINTIFVKESAWLGK